MTRRVKHQTINLQHLLLSTPHTSICHVRPITNRCRWIGLGLIQWNSNIIGRVMHLPDTYTHTLAPWHTHRTTWLTLDQAAMFWFWPTMPGVQHVNTATSNSFACNYVEICSNNTTTQKAGFSIQAWRGFHRLRTMPYSRDMEKFPPTRQTKSTNSK